MRVSESVMSTVDGPSRFVIHSVEGFGKTTLLAHFPRTLIIGNERGIPRDLPFSVATAHVDTWEGVFDIVDSLRRDEHDFLHAAFDTADWIEPLAHRFVCNRDSGRKTEMNPGQNVLESIEDYGYGKGYIVAEEEFRKLLNAIDILQHERGMHVSFAMHSHVVNFKNPAGLDYDRWEPKCHKRVARAILEWAENVFFGHFDVVSGKIPEEEKAKKLAARPKGIGGDRRLVGTTHTAMWDGKNRNRLPPEIELRDPRELIPLILGEHLKTRTPFPGYAAVDGQAAGVPAPTQHANAPAASTPASATRTAPANDAPKATSADPARTSSRTWTEPRRDVPASSSDTNGRHVEPAESTDRRATHGTATTPTSTATPDPRVELLDRSERVRGLAYRRKVEDWLSRAPNDVAIAKVIAKVNNDLAGNAPA